MSSDETTSPQTDTGSSSSNDHSNSLADVLLYADSKITRKQAVREIANVMLGSNMKPQTVKHALQLLKVLLPPENTLPATVDELFGAMMSSENDWRLAQYLIKHRQRPAFVSSPSLPSSAWSDSSNSDVTMTATRRPESLFLRVSSSSSSSNSSSESSSSSSSSSSDEDENEETDISSNVLLSLFEAGQQRLLNTSTPAVVENAVSSPVTINNSHSDALVHQRSRESVASPLDRFGFLESFKRQRSETSSVASSIEPDLFYTTRAHDDSDNETPFYPISNVNKSRCFEINGHDLLDGGKRRRHY